MLLLFVFPLLYSGNSYSQGVWSTPIYTTCYQAFSGSLSNPTVYRLLRTGSSTIVNLNTSTSGNIGTFNIEAKQVGEDDYYPLITLNVGSDLTIDAIYESVIIYPVATQNSGPGQPLLSTTLNLVDPEITVKSKSFNPNTNQMEENGCLLFGSQIYFDINLDGLCRPPLFKFKTVPGLLNYYGISSNWESDLFGQNSGHFMNMPNNFTFCNLGPNEVLTAIRCFPFEVEMKLESCDLECPDLYFSKNVSVCCECDLPQGEN